MNLLGRFIIRKVKKKLTVLKNIFRYDFDNTSIDYQVTYDITGKVYNAIPVIYSLPENAQRLILGKNFKEKKEEIENIKNLIPLILPLGIVNQSDFFQDALSEIITSINAEIKTQEIPLENIYEYAEEESLAYYIFLLSSKINLDFRLSNLREITDLIKSIVKQQSNIAEFDRFRSFARSYPYISFKIISQIVPFIKTAPQRKAFYEILEDYQSEACKDYLVNELTNITDEIIILGILKGLSTQNLRKDIKAQKELLAVFYSKIQVSDPSFIYLMRLLEQFPNEDTVSVGLEILDQNKGGVLPAANLLLQIGYPPEGILNSVAHITDGEIIGGIFRALSTQSLGRNPEIQKKALAIFHSEIELGDIPRAYLMRVLEQFPNEDTITTGLEIIHQNKGGMLAASNALLKIGCSVEKLAEIFLLKLEKGNTEEKCLALSILSDSSKFSIFLPNQEALLQTFIDIITIKPNTTLAYTMPSLMKRNYHKHTAIKIVKKLSNPNINVLEGILILINGLIYEKNLDSSGFTSEYAKSEYLYLLDHKDEKVVVEVLRIIQKIGTHEKIKEYIPLLYSKIDFDDRRKNNLAFMSAINAILYDHNVEYNPIINEKYLKALKMSNSNYRVAAIKGLRFSRDQDLKDSLSYLKDDPSREVQLILNRGGMFPPKTFSIKATKIEKIKDNIKETEEINDEIIIFNKTDSETVNSNLFKDLMNFFSGMAKLLKK